MAGRTAGIIRQFYLYAKRGDAFQSMRLLLSLKLCAALSLDTRLPTFGRLLPSRAVSRRSLLNVFAISSAARAAAADDVATDEDEAARAAALQERLRERRQLLELSRSSGDRQRYFDLSRQRAAVVYNTTSRAATCPPNIPCL